MTNNNYDFPAAIGRPFAIGVIAKNLGLKPGSPEFHALKNGDLALSGVPGGKSAGSGKDKGKGKGKGKKHNK